MLSREQDAQKCTYLLHLQGRGRIECKNMRIINAVPNSVTSLHNAIHTIYILCARSVLLLRKIGGKFENHLDEVAFELHCFALLRCRRSREFFNVKWAEGAEYIFAAARGEAIVHG